MMKIGYYAAKALIMLAGLGVAAVLLLSVLPAANGGISIDGDPELTIETSPDGMMIEIGMDIGISSTMPWDIGLEYGIVVGPEGNPIASDIRSVTIAKDQTERITMNMTIPVIGVAAHIIKEGFDNGTSSVPMTVIVKGDYIREIIKFDVKGVVEAEVPAVPASVTVDTDANTIEARMIIDEDLDDMVTDALDAVSGHSIDIGDGSVRVNLDHRNGEIAIIVESDGDITDIAAALNDLKDEAGKLAFSFGGTEYTLGADQTKMLIDMVNALMEYEGGAA